MSGVLVVDGSSGMAEQVALLCADFGREFGLSEVVVMPRVHLAGSTARLRALAERGVSLAASGEVRRALEAAGVPVAHAREAALARASVLVAAPGHGPGDAEAPSSARGTVFLDAEGPGARLAWDVNAVALRRGKERALRVAGAVAQGMAHVCAALAGRRGSRPGAVVDARFVVLRAGLPMEGVVDAVTGPLWSRAGDAGEAHAAVASARALLVDGGADVPMSASVAEVPHQLCHALHFSVTLPAETSLEHALESLAAHPRVARTWALSSAPVMALGRDHGWGGRLLNSLVIASRTVSVRDGRMVNGVAFVPDEGTVLYSAVAGVLHLLEPEGAARRLEALRPYVFSDA